MNNVDEYEEGEMSRNSSIVYVSIIYLLLISLMNNSVVWDYYNVLCYIIPLI